MTYNTHELAWAAGFFDGEGSTCLRKNRYPFITISQIDCEVLERFVKAVGVGTIDGPQLRGGNCKPIWNYRISSFYEVQHVLCLLWPWLSTIKKNQAYDVMKTVQKAIVNSKINPTVGRYAKNKSHCNKGHAMVPENIYKTKKGQTCRACRKIAGKLWREKNRTTYT